MSFLSEAAKFCKDTVLLGERVDTLATQRKEMTVRIEEHERRLIRIETLIELSLERHHQLPPP